MKKLNLRISFLIIIGVFLITFQSCRKDDQKETNKSTTTASQLNTNLNDGFNYINNPSTEVDEFCSKLSYMDPMAIKETLLELKNNHSNNAKATPQYWGIGLDYSVWKYNGSSWYQPNSAARLQNVQLGSMESNPPTNYGVWGIGLDNSVWKWSGSAWFQPNSAARLYSIAPFNNNTAIGIGGSGILFITYNGGLNWQYFGTKSGFINLSVGASNNIWGVTYNGSTTSLWYYNIDFNLWEPKFPPVQPYEVAARSTIGVYFSENVIGAKRFFRSTDGNNFIQPNTAARVYRSISAADDNIVCAIGSDNTPVNSINAGAGWGYLNPAARLWSVCVGYE